MALKFKKAAVARHLRDEDGAVTVDWVVLTAGIVLFGILAGFVVSSEVPRLAGATGSAMENMTVGSH